MSIAELLAVVPPPLSGTSVAANKWSDVEREIGTSLPSDYKAFIDQYGLGKLDDFIVVFTPYDENPHINLRIQIKRQLDALKQLGEWGEELPYPLYPEPDGLLPFGATDNGDVLYWLTSGTPERWSVVVNESRAPDYDHHDCSMTTFLAEVISGQRRCSIFPQSFPTEASFRSVR
jgi:hypothetical protein